MPKICLYFQLHQPYRLTKFSVFDLGRKEAQYFREENFDENKQVFQKVAEKSYVPMLSLLLYLTKVEPEFQFGLSCSGIFLEQALQYEPKVIELLQQLAGTGQVEFLAETYFHSLASLYSPKEFLAQIRLHEQLLDHLFHVKPVVFRNTELIYSNEVARQVAQLGYKGILTEGVDRHLGGRSRAQVFASYTTPKIPVLLKYAQLSDDIAFRFSDKNWPEYPLTSEKYLDWFSIFDQDDVVNLFMDFETFGEHQWQATGIFEFFAQFVHDALHARRHVFVTPQQALAKRYGQAIQLDLLPAYDVPQPISWADIDRDLTAWRDNPLQEDTLQMIYDLEDRVLSTRDVSLIADWRKLQTSDHFYYMCTKWSQDGDVHKYFSPYQSPYEAYNRYSTVLADIKRRISLHKN